MTTTVDVIGAGTDDDPRRPDYDGDFENAEYHGDGTVTIEIIEK